MSPRAGPVAAGAVAVVAVLLAAASLLAVVPAVAMTALEARVGSRELSPLLAIAALLWIPAAAVALRARRARRPVLLLLAAGAVVAARPVLQFGATARRAADQLGAGDQAPRFSLARMVRGLPSGDVREREVRYAAADGSPLTLRLFRGADTGARPTVVVIHGGAWRSGDAGQASSTSRALASAGFTVASIDYRHAPSARHPAQLDDVRRGLALLRDSAGAWGVDASRLALLGRSSGGHLAELAAFAPGGGAPPRAVVALYAPFDLVNGYRDLPSPDPLDVRAVLRDFLGGPPEREPARYREASPSTWVRAGLPPVLLLYGAADHAVKPTFNRAAAGALRAAGVRVVEVEVPWGEHGFDMVPSGPGGQLAFDVVRHFLARELGAAP